MSALKPQDGKLALLFLPLIAQESILPLRAGPKVAVRRYGNVSISIQGGVYDGEALPLPSGTMARRILFHAITKAWITQDAKVQLGGIREMLRDLGIKSSSKSKRRLKAELIRLSKMSIAIDYFPDGEDCLRSANVRLIQSLEIHGLQHDSQMSLLGSWLEFSPEFFETIRGLSHQPVMRDAIWDLTSPLSIDVYIWLQRRAQTHRKSEPLHLSWNHIYEQFGRGEQMSKFKLAFSAAVKSATGQMKDWGTKPAWTTTKGVYVTQAPPQVEALESKNNSSKW
jgi:plasmid replication initiation protein